MRKDRKPLAIGSRRNLISLSLCVRTQRHIRSRAGVHPLPTPVFAFQSHFLLLQGCRHSLLTKRSSRCLLWVAGLVLPLLAFRWVCQPTVFRNCCPRLLIVDSSQTNESPRCLKGRLQTFISGWASFTCRRRVYVWSNDEGECPCNFRGLCIHMEVSRRNRSMYSSSDPFWWTFSSWPRACAWWRSSVLGANAASSAEPLQVT